MSDVPSFPAGWYPDPESAAFLRWWDGVRWTEHRHPVPPQAPVSPQPQYAQSQYAQPQYAPQPSHAPAAHTPVGDPPVVEHAQEGDASAAPLVTAPEPAAPEPATEPSPPEPASAPASPNPEPAPVVTGPEPAASAPSFTPPASPTPPPLPQQPAPQQPAYAQSAAYAPYPSAAPEPHRSDIPTNTAWIWLVVLLPVLSLLSLFLLDWRGYIEDVVITSMEDPLNSTQSWVVNWTAGSIGLSLFGYLIIAAQIVFAFLDWRTLRARGIEKPFHWAWIFLALVVSNGVYVIGRGVVLRRRTGKGLAPVWAWIAVTVLGWVVGIVFAIVLMNDVFALLAQQGLLTP